MRSFRFFSLLLVAVFAGAQTPTPAGPPTMDEALAAIRTFAPMALREQGAPGMAVAITDGRRTIAIIPAGLADVESKTPVTADTRFPIGSITKSMTTLALLQLHDAGLINLNARVQQYLPSFSIDSHGEPILVHQLLSHTAGIPDDYTLADSSNYAVAALRNTHVIFAPGTSWSYSNDGFAAVGAIVANVTKDSWRHEIWKRVFRPLNMHSTSAYFSPRTLATTATGYIFRDSDLVATPPHPALIAAPTVDFVDPAGSVISTPEDMARYMRLFIDGGKTADGRVLITPASFAAMTTPDHLKNGELAGPKQALLEEWPGLFAHYGYGMGISRGGGGDHLIGHTGGVSGYTACMQINLTRGFGVIAMSNLVEAPLHPCAIVKYAMAVLRAQRLGEPLPAAPAGPPIAPSHPVPADYAATYTSANGAAVVVAAGNGGMYLTDGGKRYQLAAEPGDLFWTNDPRFTRYYLIFTRNAHKAVNGFTCGGAFFANARYTGARSFTHPKAWNALTGRYVTTTFDGTQANVRIVIVKNRLTVDGMSALAPQRNGTYKLGPSTIRFDTIFDGKMQRLWLDGADLYRINMP